jgi:hypothetical protein
MTKSKWQQYKENLGDTRPWHLLSSTTSFVAEETSSSRFNTCKVCPELIKATKQCKKCGCFMVAKTRLSDATCPLGKW